MDEKHFLITIMAGFIGTIAMTIVMYLYSLLSRQDTRVVHILGNMLTGNSTILHTEVKAISAGVIGHMGVGILFSFAYFLLWNWGTFRINFMDSVWIGLLSGGVAVIIWRTYFLLHSAPPRISIAHYLSALILAHVVFGIVTVNLFQVITDNPELWYQLQEDAKLSINEIIINQYIT